MKHLSLAILAAALALGLASTSARADLLVDGAPVKKPVPPAPALVIKPSVISVASGPQSVVRGAFFSVGTPKAGPAIEGWADKMPLSVAMDQILPKGWNLEMREGINAKNLVSWKGNRGWSDILKDMASNNGLDALVDWNNHRVILGPAGTLSPSVAAAPRWEAEPKSEPLARSAVTKTPEHPALPAVSVSALPSAAVSVDPSKIQAPSVFVPVRTAPVVAAVAVVESWTLDPARTLRQNIEAWAHRDGWTVVWTAADYPVAAKATFTGRLEAEDGPLAQVMAGYDGSEQPLLARLSTRDKVISVTNRNYVPTTINPTTPEELAPRTFPRGAGGTP